VPVSTLLNSDDDKQVEADSHYKEILNRKACEIIWDKEHSTGEFGLQGAAKDTNDILIDVSQSTDVNL
jgi:hypothetical protein